MLAAASGADLEHPQGIADMIQYSVRWAVPLIFVVTATSALARLFPGAWTRWLLRNRRYLGLSFAVAMAWQATFIALVSVGHTAHYYSDIYLLRDELEGSSGYLLLFAMVVTSFSFARRQLTPQQWSTLHRFGVYFLWAYPYSVYWWNVSYYGSELWLDYLFYGLGFLAFAARIAAWGKMRWQARQPRTGTTLAGLLLIALGSSLAVTGGIWQTTASSWLLATPAAQQLELWLPFWPFEPFLPLLVLGLGTWLMTLPATAAPSPIPTS